MVVAGSGGPSILCTRRAGKSGCRPNCYTFTARTLTVAEITLFRLDLEGATFDAESTVHLPFSGRKTKKVEHEVDGGEESETDDADPEEPDDESSADDSHEHGGGPSGKGLAVVGLLVGLVVAVVLARKRGEDSQEEDGDVEIETKEVDRPVGVTIDHDEE